MISYKCVVCGKDFIKVGRAITCSKDCQVARGVWINRETISDKRQFRKENPIVFYCRRCGKEFIKTVGNRTYCSLDCNAKNNVEIMILKQALQRQYNDELRRSPKLLDNLRKKLMKDLDEKV